MAVSDDFSVNLRVGIVSINERTARLVTTSDQRKVFMGTIGTPQGVRGEVKIRSFTADPGAIGDYGPLSSEDGRRFSVKVVRVQKGMVIAKIAGIADRNAAEALNGTDLFVDRDRLPDDALDDDEFFIADLVGMAVVDPAGASCGTVKAVYNFGAGDIVEVTGPASGLYAFTLAIFPEVDLDARRIVLVVPDEMEVHDTGAEPDQDAAP